MKLMHTKSQSHQSSSWPLLALMVGFILFPSQEAFSAETIGTIIKVQESGWATRMNDTVKKTIKTGDSIFDGDVLDIKYGNFIQIALDSDQGNVLQIEGNSVVQIFKDQIVQLELQQGKVFAILDNMDTASGFKVSSPTAISTVRGTYFQVEANAFLTETVVYEGIVHVAGKRPNGKPTRQSVLLTPGQKTSVTDTNPTPVEPQIISKKEFEQVNSVIQRIGGNRELLLYENIFLESEQKKNESKKTEFANGSTQADSSGAKANNSDEFDAGMVVF